MLRSRAMKKHHHMYPLAKGRGSQKNYIMQLKQDLFTNM